MVKSGSLSKSEYLKVATKILSYMQSYGCAPNYVATSLGEIPYKNLIYAYSKILNYYKVNKVLPSSVSIQELSLAKIVSTSPINNEKDVTVTKPITITFNGKISSGSQYSGIIVRNIVTGAKLKISKIISGNILTIKTATRMYNKTYKVYIPAGAVKNSLGKGLANSYTIQFTTMPKETIPPTVITTNPLNDATGFSLTEPITITFSEKIVSSTNFSGIVIKNMNNGKTASLASKIISGTVLTIKMTYSRLSGKIYKVYIPARAIKDLCNNQLASFYTFKFTTA
jgi:methionine-rich copper-binding protein CopC